VTVIGDRIEHVVRTGLGPALKNAGYRKTARTFRQTSGLSIKVTNLQASWTNLGSEGRFTLNLGVYFPEAARLHGLFPVTDKPLESHCVVHQRIGFLMPGGRDFWWEVTALTDLDDLAAQVVDAWERYGRSWLDEHTDVLKARDFMIRLGMPFWAAVFSLVAGNQSDAAAFLDQALKETGSRPDFQITLRTWGRKNGLL